MADAGTLQAGKTPTHRARREPARRHQQHAAHLAGILRGAAVDRSQPAR